MRERTTSSAKRKITSAELYDAADKLAPFSLSGEYCQKFDAYDNSGILLDCGEGISKILFSLDLSRAVIARAKEIGADCIFTHHPAIFHPLHKLETEGAGALVLDCAQAHINVISAHLNLDCAEGGIDECLMKGLGGTHAEACMHELSQGAYGRVYSVPQRPLPAFVNGVKETFSSARVISYGAGEVKRVASFCGAGMDEESVSFAVKNGADTFVSSDPKHHLITELSEKGLNIVLLPHYAAEAYGFEKFYINLKNTLSVDCEFYIDERYL